MLSTLKSVLVVALVVGAFAGARPAVADDKADEARRLFAEGDSAYNLGEFAEAIAKFKAAYRVRPEPALLFNIAQCHRQMKENERALFFYRSYLRSAPDTPNRKHVEARIRELETPSASQARDRPPAPKVPLGGRSAAEPAAAAAPVAEAPGPQTLIASTPAPAAPAPEAVVTAPAPDSPRAPPPIYKRWWFWTAIGAAAAAGIAIGVAADGPSGPPSTTHGTTGVF